MITQILTTGFIVAFAAVVVYGHVLLFKAMFSGPDRLARNDRIQSGRPLSRPLCICASPTVQRDSDTPRRWRYDALSQGP